jgi:hypothetical protein
VIVYKGIIRGFHGSWGSGLGTLEIEDSKTHAIRQVYCENGSTVRALEGSFGNVIGNAHNVSQNGGHIGKEIYWSLDDMGMILEAFTPVDEASPELEEAYENNQEDEG